MNEPYPIKPTSWIQTHTNVMFDPFNIQPEDLSIEDIAHALSNTCRWGGHCSRFYSVAQHSVMVMHQVPSELRLSALLHDAAETYIGDMPSPLKALLPDYKRMERSINEAIEAKYNVVLKHPAIKTADRKICKWEAYNLLDTELVEVWAGENPLPHLPMFKQSPEHAKQSFLYWYKSITDTIVYDAIN